MLNKRGKVVDEGGKEVSAYLPSSMVEEAARSSSTTFCNIVNLPGIVRARCFFRKQIQLSSIVISTIAILWLQRGVFY